MTATEELVQLSRRNYAYTKARLKNEVEKKCFDCEKFGYYGKTCNGKCVVKESTLTRPEMAEDLLLSREPEVIPKPQREP